MKRLFIIPLILLLCAVVVIGCGTPAPTTPTTPTTPVTPATPTAPATPAKPATPSAPAAPTAPTTPTKPAAPAKPAAPTAPVYGGKITYIDPSSPGCPLGLPWQCRGPYVGAQLCLEAVIGSTRDGTITPVLAESWDIDSNPDHPSFTFHLRKGVKFHDGTDWNADAFIWNLYKYRDGGMFVATRYIKTYEKVDDYTVRLPLTMWRNTILPAFAMAPIASPTAYEQKGEDWMRWNIVGTGPFKQTEFIRDQSFKAVRFDDYWQQGKPYLFEVEYLSVAEEMTRLALLKSGQGDIMNLNKNGRVASELKAQGANIITQPAGTLSLMPDSVNETSPWSNLKVREAAEYAIDKEAIAKALGFGFAEAADQWYSKESQAYVPNLPGRKYDPDKAKQLLKEAGFPSGFKTKIISENTVNRDVVTSLQSYLSAVGIECDLDFPDAAKFTSYTRATWDNALLCLTMRTGAFPTQGITFTSEPRVQYKSNKNPANWMDNYNHIMTTPELDLDVLWAGMKAIYDDVMLIPIMYSDDMIMVSDKVHDHGIGTKSGATNWTPENAWLSK
jgi:peptide/nickel transport system substrate-binding protein